MFQRLVADDRVELKRFDGYFEGPAANPGVVLAVVPDDTMRGLELRKGTIDLVLNDLSPDIVRDLERRGEVRLRAVDAGLRVRSRAGEGDPRRRRLPPIPTATARAHACTWCSRRRTPSSSACRRP